MKRACALLLTIVLFVGGCGKPSGPPAAGKPKMALGAVASVQAAGRTGKVLIAGFDNISAIAPMIQSGQVAATADQHGGQLAVFGIEAALKILQGNSAPADQTTAVDLITKQSAPHG